MWASFPAVSAFYDTKSFVLNPTAAGCARSRQPGPDFFYNIKTEDLRHALWRSEPDIAAGHRNATALARA